MPPQELATLENGSVGSSVEVRLSPLPASVSRHELVLRAGPEEMTILDNERWTSPLNEEIKEAVELDLASGLMKGVVHTPGPSGGKIVADIAIERFEAAPGRYASVVAIWSVYHSGLLGAPDHLRGAECVFTAYEPIGKDVSEVVQGFQRELKELSQDILRAAEAPLQRSYTCPSGAAPKSR